MGKNFYMFIDMSGRMIKLMIQLFVIQTIIQRAICSDLETINPATTEEPSFEYLYINGSAVLLSGILLAQIAFVSERWLFFASIPLILSGLGLLIVDNRTRERKDIKFLRGSKKNSKRPWLVLEYVAAWPENPNYIDE